MLETRTLLSAVADGAEFRVNSFTAGSQFLSPYGGGHRTAIAASGQSVVVWESNAQDGNGQGVFAQLYDAQGNPFESEFRVNSTTMGGQSSPVVGMDAFGNFVVAWDDSGADGDDYGVYAKRFFADGRENGSEFRVNTFTTGSQGGPAVAMATNGSFVITWVSQGQDGDNFGIYAQAYYSFGSANGTEFRVNTYTTGYQNDPTVATDASGDFVVVWTSQNQDGNSEGIFSQRYTSSLFPIGSELRVNTSTLGNQSQPAIAMDADGDYVVTWSGYGTSSSGFDIFGQRYSSNGPAVGTEFRINTSTLVGQTSSDVAMDADGDFVVAWSSGNSPAKLVKLSGAGETLTINGSGANDALKFVAKRNIADATNNPISVRIAAVGNNTARSISVVGNAITIYLSTDGAGAILATETANSIRDSVMGTTAAAALVNVHATEGTGNGVLAALSATNLFRNSANDDNNDLVITDVRNRAGSSDKPIYVAFEQAGTSTPLSAAVVETAEAITITFELATDASGQVTTTPTFLADFAAFHADVPDYISIQNAGTSTGFGILSATAGAAEPLAGGLDDGIYAHAFRADGTARGSEFFVNTFNSTTGSRTAPFVAMDADGDFQIAWSSQHQDGDSYGVYAQRYNEQGSDEADDAGPWVTATKAFNASLDYGDRLLDHPSEITIEFSEALATTGAGRGANPANYTLQRDGADANSSITSITHTANLVTLQFSTPLLPGSYALSLLPTLTDLSGNGLDGNYDGFSGGVTLRYFDVAEPSALGSEFRVTTSTVGLQSQARVQTGVAADQLGNFVVTWFGMGTGESTYGIYAQRFSRAGTALGSEFRVNSHTTDAQRDAAIAMDADGDFVIVWPSNTQDGDGYGIYAQRFAADGTRQGTEFRVHSTTTGTQITPTVAMDSDGDFVVAWTSVDADGQGVFAQRFNAAGTALGTEFRVNSSTTRAQQRPGIAVDQNGDFLVVWSSDHVANGDANIYAQRYDVSGGALGGEFRVNSTTTGNQLTPTVATSADGYFVVAWIDETGTDGNSSGIFTQRFSPLGTALGSEFVVNTTTSLAQSEPRVALDADGDFVITWTSLGQDGDGTGIYAQRYHASGVPQGSEFRVNTHTLSGQSQSHVAMSLFGDFIITWTSPLQDGSDYGVYAQIYSAAPPQLSTIKAFDDVVPANSRLLARPNSLTLTFNKELAASSTDTAHYQLHRGATNVSSLVSSVTQSATSATLNLSTALVPGTYTVTVLDTLTDIEGIRLDGDRNDYSGGSATHTFQVADLAPKQSEFRINTYTTGEQINAYGNRSVAMNATGEFVVTWSSSGQDGDSEGVYAQRFTSAGMPLGEEFRVNTWTTNVQKSSAIAIDNAGDFVIVWSSFGQDGSGYGVYAQRYSADGQVAGTEFRVNSTLSGPQSIPSVDMDADGDFVVTWQSDDGDGFGIFAQRYSAAGVPQGSEFRVNSTTTATQVQSMVGMNAAGEFVVAWSGSGADGNGYGVVGQRYLADGSPIGTEFVINTFTTGTQSSPAVAIGDDGEFVVVWQGTDGNGNGVFAQQFSSLGAPVGAEFQVNTETGGNQHSPEVAIDATGDFVVVWTSVNQDGDGEGVYARNFLASGLSNGSEFRVNSYTTGSQTAASVAMDQHGDFVVAWTSYVQEGTGDAGVIAQRYHTDHTLPYITAIADDHANNLVGLNVAVTYTITFSEDIDIYSFTASDIGNAANASFTVGAIVETSPGVVSVVVTPTSAGVFVLRILGAADVRDVAGNSVPAAVTDNDAITVDATPPYIVSIVDDDPNNLAGLNQILTYTVTFSEDLAFNGSFASRFVNAGTASFSVGSVVENSAGVLSVPVTITSPGTFRLRVLSGAPLADLQANSLPGDVFDDDTMTTDTATPYITGIDDDITDNVFGPNETVIYTVTFSDDIDFATVHTSDFGGGGSAGFVIGAITEPSPGVLVVPVMFTSTGAFRFKVLGSADIRDTENNALSVEIADNDVLVGDFVRPYVQAISDDDPFDDLVGLHQSIVYTVTFSEDIDSLSLTAADFSNAITVQAASFTIGAITETSPTSGVFLVPLNITSSGALQLCLPNSANVVDANGNLAWVPVKDNNVFVVDSVRPIVLAASMDDADGQVRVGDTVHVSIMFSKAINSGSISESAFTNLGTAAFTVGTITEPTAHTYRIPITVTSTGAIVLTLNDPVPVVDRQLNRAFAVNLGIVLIVRP